MNKKRVYYAHPVSLYGTKQEDRDVSTLINLGFEVVNPNHAIHQDGYERSGMIYFTELVRSCDALAFRAFPDGSIGAGIVYEIGDAERLQKPVFELPVGILSRGLTIAQTREYLSQVGQR